MNAANGGSSPQLSLSDDDGLYRITTQQRHPHFVHALTPRRAPALAGEGDFNFRPDAGAGHENAAENRALLAQSLGVALGDTVWFTPGKSEEVVWVSDDDRGKGATDWRTRLTGAAVVTRSINLFLCTLYNDNLVVLLHDPRWFAAGMATIEPSRPVPDALVAAVALMVERIGSRREEIVAFICPSMGPCCHTFTDFSQVGTSGRSNLWDLARSALFTAGLRRDRVFNPHKCTACFDTELFSHKIDGAAGGAGAVVVGIRDDPMVRRRLADLQSKSSRPATIRAEAAGVAAQAESNGASHLEVDPSLIEEERRLNKAMKCPYGHNKVYVRSLITGTSAETSEPELALRCAVMSHVGFAMDGYNIVPREYILAHCCGDFRECSAYQEFIKRKRR